MAHMKKALCLALVALSAPILLVAAQNTATAPSPANSHGGGASGGARTLTLSLDGTAACGAVKPHLAIKAFQADLQALLTPLSKGAKVASARLTGCSPSKDGRSTFSFVATVTSPKSASDPSGAAVLPATAQINNSPATALPRTTKVVDGTGTGRAAWRASHFITAVPANDVLGYPVRYASFSLGKQGLKYPATIDTGSPLLAAPCNTPAKIKVCNGQSDPNALDVDASNYITTKEQCDAAGIACWATAYSGSPSEKQCWFSQALTGGNGFNSPAGVFVRDQWKIENVAGAGSLLIPEGVIACKERYMYAKDKDEKEIATACPPPLEDVGSMKAQCIGAASSDAGWTFATSKLESPPDVTPSAVSIPQQAYDAGLFESKVLSFCWPAAPRISDCAAKDATAPNIAILGPAVPQGLRGKRDLVEVPLVYNPTKGAQDSSQPATGHFYSTIPEARVPKFGGGAKSIAIKKDERQMLWDTGAGGSATVPKDVLKAYLEWFDAAKDGVKKDLEDRGGKVDFWVDKGKTKAETVSAVCGGNYAIDENAGGPARWVMTRYTLPDGAKPSDVAYARKRLSELFPPTVDVRIEDGPVVPLPGSLVVNEDCDKGGPTKISVCSMYRDGHGDRFWFAIPWFQGRFVQFDVSPAVQTATRYGFMRYATPPSGSCKF